MNIIIRAFKTQFFNQTHDYARIQFVIRIIIVKFSSQIRSLQNGFEHSHKYTVPYIQIKYIVHIIDKH